MHKREQRRPAFEKWVTETIGRDGWPDHPEWACERNSNGNYASTRVQGAWEGWNAALDRAEEVTE